MNAAFLTSLASWHELERGMDRWASIGALVFASCACVVFVLLN